MLGNDLVVDIGSTAIPGMAAKPKRRLAASFRSDREAYTNGKNDCIRAVMAKAQCEDINKTQ
ncbi:GrpB family protein [Nostoc sp. MG11]|uniref:GrpB family protein n=1 Tax=Nostoc sp. MG11 TaxID=2721166 RepID=UPI001D00896A|nr:GrpB family protein [Nostoc sp. MG11]